MNMYKFKNIKWNELWRSTLFASLLILATLFQSACQAASMQKITCISISGKLTLKGSEPGTWWAVADDQGRIWKITSPTSEQVIFFQKVQNQRISLQGRRLEKYLNFEQIQLCRIVSDF